MMKRTHTALLLVMLVSFSKILAAKVPVALQYPVLVNKFYELTKREPFWISSEVAYPEARQEMLSLLDNAVYNGLDPQKYHYAEITSVTKLSDQADLTQADRMFTDALISLSRDVYAGSGVEGWIMNDEISGKYYAADNDFLLGKLAVLGTVSEAGTFLMTITPQDNIYNALANELKTQLAAKNERLIPQLKISANIYRWIHHFHFDKFIVVNVPAASLRYYEQGNEVLQMKVVVGKPSTRTPRFSSHCDEVVLYPYWNVPRSIAVKELLPKFKRSPGAIDAMNMQVVAKNGAVVDHTRIKWSQYNGSNLPYLFRQSTGCDNSLGVIKFNLTDPFSVYLHDTNFKKAFSSKSRFLSHGCIRVEKPVELGNYLLNNRLDKAFVSACIKGQKPVITKLQKPVPVFVVYMTADVDSTNNVVISKDIYHIFK